MNNRIGVSNVKNLKIGSDCFFYAISANLEYLDKLWISLYYTNGAFLFSQDTFGDIQTTKEISEYFSPDNMLIFAEKPKSIWRDHYDSYIAYNLKKVGVYDCIKSVRYSTLFDIEKIKRYTDNNICLLIPIIVSDLRDEYAKISRVLPQADRTLHFICIMDINLANRTVHIADPYFRVNGILPFESIINAAERTHSMDSNQSLYYIASELLPEYGKNNNPFTWCFDMYKTITVEIENVQYYSGYTAAESVADNISQIVKDYYSIYGKFASQFLSYQLTPIIRQKNSIVVLLEALEERYKDQIPLGLISVLKHNSTLWSKLDFLLDTIYLRNQNIIQEVSRIQDIFREICENDRQVYKIVCYRN